MGLEFLQKVKTRKQRKCPGFYHNQGGARKHPIAKNARNQTNCLTEHKDVLKPVLFQA